MARARNIKPGFFANDSLALINPLGRILFAGLWCLADREGRLQDRPLRIKAEILPYDECDVNEFLEELEKQKFIRRYEVEGVRYLQIANFAKHQNPHRLESPSQIPPPPGEKNTFNHTPISPKKRARIYARDGHKCVMCGANENLQIDHIRLVSQGGTSDDDNLRTLCGQCNNKRSKKDKSRSNRADSLIPDSLIPDSLIPDSLIQTTSTNPPDSLPQMPLRSEPEPEGVKPEARKVQKANGVPYERIQALYHECLPDNPPCRVLTTKRKGQISARWHSGALPDLETWRKFFLDVAKSRWLTGQVDPGPGRRRFVADLEWLTNESNYAKILEGKYRNG